MPQNMRMPYWLLKQSVLKILYLRNNFSTLCDSQNNIQNFLKKRKNGNFIYFLKSSSEWFSTSLEVDNCAIIMYYYSKMKNIFFDFHTDFFIFRSMFFFVLGDTDKSFIIFSKNP